MKSSYKKWILLSSSLLMIGALSATNDAFGKDAERRAMERKLEEARKQQEIEKSKASKVVIDDKKKTPTLGIFADVEEKKPEHGSVRGKKPLTQEEGDLMPPPPPIGDMPPPLPIGDMPIVKKTPMGGLKISPQEKLLQEMLSLKPIIYNPKVKEQGGTKVVKLENPYQWVDLKELGAVVVKLDTLESFFIPLIAKKEWEANFQKGVYPNSGVISKIRDDFLDSTMAMTEELTKPSFEASEEIAQQFLKFFRLKDNKEGTIIVIKDAAEGTVDVKFVPVDSEEHPSEKQPTGKKIEKTIFVDSGQKGLGGKPVIKPKQIMVDETEDVKSKRKPGHVFFCEGKETKELLKNSRQIPMDTLISISIKQGGGVKGEEGAGKVKEVARTKFTAATIVQRELQEKIKGEKAALEMLISKRKAIGDVKPLVVKKVQEGLDTGKSAKINGLIRQLKANPKTKTKALGFEVQYKKLLSTDVLDKVAFDKLSDEVTEFAKQVGLID